MTRGNGGHKDNRGYSSDRTNPGQDASGCSPWPRRSWAVHARRVPPYARRHGWRRLRLRVDDQVAISHWIVRDGEFEHAVDTRQSTSGSARQPEAAARPRPNLVRSAEYPRASQRPAAGGELQRWAL